MAVARNLLLACLGIVLIVGCSQASNEEQGPLVLAAASLQEVLEESADEWAARGHARPVLSFAGTASLARQVEAGAGGDLFIAADEAWMDHVEARGLLAEDSRRVLAGNRLALIAPADSNLMLELGPDMDLAAVLGDGRLAMAEPESVPAGRYARQALEALGQWDGVQGKLAIGENVRVALALVSRAEAPLGIAYQTDAEADSNVRIISLFSNDIHSPIRYPIARLGASASPDAEAFSAFLLSAEGQDIFARHGFLAGQN